MTKESRITDSLPHKGSRITDSLLQQEFPVDDDLIHLNHAGVGPWPRRCADAVQRFAEAMCTRSYAGAFPEWIETEQRLRERLRALINAPSVDDIALLKNTSEALSQVAHGLDWQPGDTVVVLTEEFVSNLITWEALAQRGARLVRVTPAGGETPEDALEAACDEHTRLVTVSTVQYGTGYRLDCARIGAFCNARGILFCVDAVQSLGALRFDTQACHADFAVAGSHKWLMSPFGIALFWCRAELRERIRPLAYGWHTVAEPMRFGGSLVEIERSARRYEAGTANWPALVGFEASLSLLDEVGHAKAERRVLANAAYLADALASRQGVSLVSPREAGRFGGNVCIRVAGQDLAALAERLESAGVLCAARGSSLRFSPHYYTGRDRIDAALTSFDQACML